MTVPTNLSGKNGASFVTKVLVGVMTAMIIASILFGLDVYTFMQAGPRLTPTDMQEYTEKRYVRKDVYEVQQNHILDELKEIKALIKEKQ